MAVACVLAADTDKIVLAVVFLAEGREPFLSSGPRRMLPQTSQGETEVNTIISNLYGLTGGQVHNFVSKRMELTCDRQILEIIPLCHIEFGEIPTQKRWSAVTNLKHRFSDQEKATIDDLIAESLSKGIVSYSEPQVDQILSPIFLRP